MMRLVITALLALLLTACSAPEGEYQIPKQKWGDVVIEVQSRPTQVKPGTMNEFLVLATTEHGRPVHDLVISLRCAYEPWQQAIQDGFSGVYRKAVEVPAGVPTIEVQLRKKRTDTEMVMSFPLYPPKSDKAAAH